MDFFVFDNQTNSLRINEYTILLVKEFAVLWKKERNITNSDKDGELRTKAWKEFTYLFLMLDYKSPYFKYKELDKHDAALIDSGLTEEDLKDPDFIAAFNKYIELQENTPILSLIKTANLTLYKMKVFLDNIDFNDVDEQGRPLYKPKDVIADISSIAKMRTQLQELEVAYKENLTASAKTRGDYELGYDEF